MTSRAFAKIVIPLLDGLIDVNDSIFGPRDANEMQDQNSADLGGCMTRPMVARGPSEVASAIARLSGFSENVAYAQCRGCAASASSCV